MQQYSDEARRMADAITLHSIAGSAGQWCAIRLMDGKNPDNTAYPTRDEAVRAMKWDRDRFFYVLIPPDGMQPKAADAVIRYSRAAYDAGFRLPDPGIAVPTMPLTKPDARRQISALTR